MNNKHKETKPDREGRSESAKKIASLHQGIVVFSKQAGKEIRDVGSVDVKQPPRNNNKEKKR